MALSVGLAYTLKTRSQPGLGEVEDEAADYDDPQTIREIAGALESGGHQVIDLPYGAGLFDSVTRSRPDIVFNLAEGQSGRARETIVPALLEYLGIPYTGSDPITLGVSLDKTWAKILVAEAGIPTPRFLKIGPSSGLPPDLGGLMFPMFVKPNAEGSSKGIRFSSKVTTCRELEAMVEWVHTTYGQAALVEEYLPGPEYSVGLVGNGDSLTVLPVVAVRAGRDVPRAALGDNPAEEFIYSYEVKSRNMEAADCPPCLPGNLGTELAVMARRVWDALECRDLARVDFKLGADGRPQFLEVNPLPGLSREEGFLPLAGRAVGLGYDELILLILDQALLRCGFTREPGSGGWLPWRAA